MILECMECGTRVSFSSDVDVECPKCGSTDLDLTE